MNFEAVKKRNASQIVADQIMGQIKSKILAPGQKLPAERELAEMFGVGRSSVREAVKALSVIGYLDIHQGKGTYVSPDACLKEMSVQHFMELLDLASFSCLMEALEIIECRVVALAAKRANAQQILQIGEAIIKMQQQGLTPHEFLNADQEFHYALAVAADNLLLCEMVKLLVEQVHKRNENPMVANREGRLRYISSANKLFMHIRFNDPQKAAEEMRRHLDFSPDQSGSRSPNFE